MVGVLMQKRLNSQKEERPSMRDVAKRAGVSTATVSHVLNKTQCTSEQVTARVYEAVNALGYVPNYNARSLRTGKKGIIGFVLPDISNSYFATIIEEVENVLGENGYHLIIVNTREDEENEEYHIKYLASGVVDALLIASTMHKYERLERLLPINFPVLLVDRYFENSKYDTVTVSSSQAIYNCIRELFFHNHSKIGFIAGIPHISTTIDRVKAYQQAMLDFKLPVLDGMVQYGNSMRGSAQKCVETLQKIECTAIIVSNGLMSIDAHRYLNNQAGKPMELVCFDDLEISSFLFAATSTICLPTRDLGRIASQQIIKRINEPNRPKQDIILNCVVNMHINND